jgi:NADH dehydrogenase [ubiquinone] 1 alpha subcomplex assembly factor 7
MSKAASLQQLLHDQITNDGPLTIAEYMTQCLQNDQFGYYMRNDPFGIKGDFVTSPEISQIFGELIGAWLGAQFLAMRTSGAALVELGPGRGTLMADILRATRHIPGFHDGITVHLVESSPHLKKLQWKNLAGKHAHIHWHDDISSIPKKPLLLVTNEFFDALPIRQFRHHKEKGWKERVVTLNKDGELAFGYVAVKPPKALASLPVADELYEYSPASHHVMKQIASHCKKHGGTALIIDYGYSRGTHGDTLQAVKSHQFYDLLTEPGTADISAHVDFKALADTAHDAGTITYPPVSQGAFLLRLGAELRLQALSQGTRSEEKNTILSGFKRLTSPDEMGELFKVLCITHPDHPKPEGF